MRQRILITAIALACFIAGLLISELDPALAQTRFSSQEVDIDSWVIEDTADGVFWYHTDGREIWRFDREQDGWFRTPFLKR